MTDRPRRGRRRRVVDRDEFGGSEDGGLAIILDPDQTIHLTPPRVATALRFLLARAQSGGQVLPHRIALTAALRGEGVTYLTRSLASVLAYDTESTVVVVDLNWKLPVLQRSVSSASPTQSEVPGGRDDAQPSKAAGGGDVVDTDAAPGPAAVSAGRQPRRRRERGSTRVKSSETTPETLANVLDGDADVADVIKQTTNPRLSLVMGGELALARRPAVAGGRALSTIVDEIADGFDHVLLDLPPVLASSDAIQLAKLSDAFALVVLQGVTPEHQIDAAIRELAGVECLGVILNRFDSKVPKFLRRMVEA